MKSYDCDAVRDMLHELHDAAVLPHERAAAEDHIAVCGECAAERAVVDLVRNALEPVPAGLENRVLAAVRAAPVGLRRRSPARLAMAATLAAAVLGASLIAPRVSLLGGFGMNVMAAFELDDTAISQVSWAAAEDPLLNDRMMLDDLTIEELEILLAELD